MNQSPLRLERYVLLAIKLEPAANSEPAESGYQVDFDKADFRVGVNFSPIEISAGETRFAVDLTLEAKPKAETVGFSYNFFLQMIGFFDGQRIPEDKRNELVIVNGASMLYSAARELLLGLSARAIGGTVLLPSLSFAYLAKQVRQKALRNEDDPEASSE